MSLKQKVIEELEKNRDSAISGQELADRLGVTRAAVWKAIKSLQLEGHSVSATTNKGYTLKQSSDVVSEQGIRISLAKELLKLEIITHKKIDSTNSFAKREISENGVRELLVVANEQTDGRGRQGKSFFSPSDSGIYMSLVLCPNIKLTDSLLTTVAAAVAVCEAVEELTEKEPKIKWVNDIFCDNKKLCGILTEGVSNFETGMVDAIIIGIGINFKSSEFPDEIKSIATALNPTSLTRNQLIANICTRLMELSKNLVCPELIERYKSRLMVLGKKITFTRGEQQFNALAIDINEHANLIVKHQDGSIEVLTAGEISIGSENLVI